MKRKVSQKALFQILERSTARIPDHRNIHRITHKIRDAIFIIFSCFFLQAESLRSHFENLHKGHGPKNRGSLFRLSSIPSEQHTRDLLDDVTPDNLLCVMDQTLRATDRSLILREFKVDEQGGYAVAIDGLEWLRSEKLRCDTCLHCTHGDGRKEYFHRAVVAGIVHPEQDIILPLAPEFVSNNDGCTKQDCEIKAGKRWVESWRKRHHKMKITVLGDDLYCKQAMLQTFLDAGCNFIVTCKESSHSHLYRWVSELDAEDLKTASAKVREGATRLIYRYEFANDVPIRDTDDALKVNFVRVTISCARTRKARSTFAFTTNLRLTLHNVARIAQLGRKRWKIENENNNRLKTLHYNLEHNFGHGHQHLVYNMFMLNLIAMLFHVILEYVGQSGFAMLRRFWNTLGKAIAQMRHAFISQLFTDWEAIYRYARCDNDTS